MHDIDRTQLEWEQYEHDLGAPQAYEFPQEFEGEYGEVPLHEANEMELAVELLEVTNEAELEAFLGNVFGAVGRTLGRFARSDAGAALTGLVRNAARDALPTVGGAIGDWAAPGRGGAIGSRLAQQAGQLLGLELEGLSPQEQEFEAARQFVRFAGSAYANAATAPRDAHPLAAAQQAATAAAHQFAPGIAPVLAEAQEGEYGRSRSLGARRAPRGQSGHRPRAYPRYRRGPRVSYGYPGYAAWAPYPSPVESPYAADGAPAEPAWGSDEPAGPPDGAAEELGAGHAGSNGHPGGARNGRWIRRGRVLVIFGA